MERAESTSSLGRSGKPHPPAKTRGEIAKVCFEPSDTKTLVKPGNDGAGEVANAYAAN